VTREQERQSIVEMLARLLALGLSPLQAVGQLEQATGHYRRELRAMRGALEQGQPLPDAPRLLPPELPALLRAGRQGADLASVMTYATRYLTALHGALRTALLPLFYPLLLLAVLMLVSVSLYRKVIPVLQVEPGVLRLFGSSRFGVALVVLAALLSYWILWRRRRVNPVTRVVRALLRVVPGVRSMLDLPALAAAAGSLAVTLRAGLGAGQALRLAAEACRSPALQAALHAAGRAAAAGAPLDQALDQANMPQALRAAAAGEGDDRPLALEAVANAALDEIVLRVQQASVVGFSVALLLAALCVGSMVVKVYGVVFALPGSL